MTKKPTVKKERAISRKARQSALIEGFMSIPALPRALSNREMDEIFARSVAEEFMRESRDPERWGSRDA